MTGPSNIYRRLLNGQVTPERYVAVVKRAVEMGRRIDREDRRRMPVLARVLADRARRSW